jgi:hypothetical protein
LSASAPSGTSNSNPDLLTLNSGFQEPINSQNVISSRRFIREIDSLLTTHDDIIIKANFAIPDDRKTPLLVLVMPNKETKLYLDLVRYSIPGIIFAIYFTNGK